MPNLFFFFLFFFSQLCFILFFDSRSCFVWTSDLKVPWAVSQCWLRQFIVFVDRLPCSQRWLSHGFLVITLFINNMGTHDLYCSLLFCFKQKKKDCAHFIFVLASLAMTIRNDQISSNNICTILQGMTPTLFLIPYLRLLYIVHYSFAYKTHTPYWNTYKQ